MLLAAGMAGLLNLASVEYRIKCELAESPQVNIIPETRDVVYDFSRSSADLTGVKSDTVSPYAPGTRTITEGLRVDQPKITAQVEVSYQMYEKAQQFCINYKKVDVHIFLAPTIYIASEWKPGVCRDAILTHEQKHVHVDRDIVNEVAAKLGATVLSAVKETGSAGPYPANQLQTVQGAMTGYIDTLVKQMEGSLEQDQRARQAQVDSLEEYTRIGAICRQP